MSKRNSPSTFSGRSQDAAAISRFGQQRNEDGNGGCTWAQAEPKDLWEMVWRVTEAGAAVTLAKTRAGDCVSITVLDGDSRYRAYKSSPEELSAELRNIAAEADEN